MLFGLDCEICFVWYDHLELSEYCAWVDSANVQVEFGLELLEHMASTHACYVHPAHISATTLPHNFHLG